MTREEFEIMYNDSIINGCDAGGKIGGWTITKATEQINVLKNIFEHNSEIASALDMTIKVLEEQSGLRERIDEALSILDAIYSADKIKYSDYSEMHDAISTIA